MSEKIYFLFLFCAITIKAQQYCTYGPDIFPWNPYRCPPFLANRTTAQRDEYYFIANNCTAPFSEIKKQMVNWGSRLGEGTAVENYIQNVTMFMNYVARLVKNQEGEHKIQRDLDFLMTTDTVSLGWRNDALVYVLRSRDPFLPAVVNAWSNYGIGGPFKNTNSGPTYQFGFNGYTPTPNQYNQNNQQYNPYGQSNQNGQQAPWNAFNQQNQFNSNGFTTSQPFGGQFPNDQFNPYNQQGEFNFNGYTSHPNAVQWNNNQWNNNQRNQYCKYGDNIFPWFPYRCPYFLSSLTETQRDGYFAIANNKTISLKDMTNGLVNWAYPIRIASNVSSYTSYINAFYKTIEQKTLLKYTPEARAILSVLINVNWTQSNRDYMVMNVMSDAEPKVTTVLEQINRFGSEEEFGIFLRSYRPNSWEAVVFNSGAAPNNQYPYGNYGELYGYGQQGTLMKIGHGNHGVYTFDEIRNPGTYLSTKPENLRRHA